MRDTSCVSKAVCLAHLYKVYQSNTFNNLNAGHADCGVIEPGWWSAHHLLTVLCFDVLTLQFGDTERYRQGRNMSEDPKDSGDGQRAAVLRQRAEPNKSKMGY